MELGTEFYRAVLDNLYDGVYVVDRDRRITYWNRGAELLTGYSSEQVMGSRCSDNILEHVDSSGNCLCDSDCPLADAVANGQTCEKEVYLRHRDGHRMPVSIRAIPIRDSAGEVVGALEVFRDISGQYAVQQKMRELEKMALLDSLTRLANRRHTEANLQIRLEEFFRYGWPFGILFVDIDHFKKINDDYGHEEGDKVLRLVSMTLLNSLRPFDFLGRWGGEEFVAIVVNVNEQQLGHIANRARALVEQSALSTRQESIRVTVSIGATMARPADTVRDLVRRADRLMYASKQAGRNRVSTETPVANPELTPSLHPR